MRVSGAGRGRGRVKEGSTLHCVCVCVCVCERKELMKHDNNAIMKKIRDATKYCLISLSLLPLPLPLLLLLSVRPSPTLFAPVQAAALECG